MKARDKTKEQLISELRQLRQRVSELETSESNNLGKLQKSEEFNRTLVENIADRVFAKDTEGRYILLNKVSYDFWGIPYGTALGKTDWEIHDEITAEAFLESDRVVFETGKPYFGEENVKGKDGQDLILSVTKAPLKDKTGEIIGLAGISRDITAIKRAEETLLNAHEELERRVEERTAELMEANEQLKRKIEERKQAEELLRESEQRYSSLFKINHSVMLVIDPENADIVDANPAACSFYGWSQEELTSMKITDINMLSKEQVFQEMERAKSEERQHFFFRHRLANEEIRDVEVYSGPLRLHGKKLLYSIIHDITERRRAEEQLQKSEERYRLLVETMNEGLAMADHNYVFTYVNERFCEMIGCSRDEMIGHNLIEFVHDDYKESMKDQMAGRKMGKAKRFDLVWRAKDGHKVYTLASPRGFFDAEGRFTGSLGVLTDITDRKQVEKALRKAHDRLERRTTELVKLNRKMKQEIEERKLAEQELRKREAQLEINTNELEEVNTALRVLLKRRDEDKTDLEEKILSNVKELVLPYVERLRKSGMDAKQSAYVSILESNLNDVVSPFIHKLSSKYVGLTPTEIQIANLVKEGRTTKEIAEMLNSSSGTVEFHRKNIRKKIGIVNRKANLRSHLLSM